MNLDSNGLIVQADGDGGDSAQRTGFYYSALMIRSKLNIPNDSISVNQPLLAALNLLITPDGLIRNPIKWNDPKDTSRDQTVPIIIACGLYGYLAQLSRVAPRKFRFQNGDIESPQNFNEITRANGYKPGILGDIWAYFAAVTRCFNAKSNLDDVGDDINLILSLSFFYVDNPTIISKYALSYYLNNRPVNYGVTKLGEIDNVMGALSWYFRVESGGNPELAEIWRPIVKHLRDNL